MARSMGKVPADESRCSGPEYTPCPRAGLPVCRPRLASLTAFCRHGGETSEHEGLPVDAGHVPPQLAGNLLSRKPVTNESGQFFTHELPEMRLRRASSSRTVSPRRKAAAKPRPLPRLIGHKAFLATPTACLKRVIAKECKMGKCASFS